MQQSDQVYGLFKPAAPVCTSKLNVFYQKTLIRGIIDFHQSDYANDFNFKSNDMTTKYRQGPLTIFFSLALILFASFFCTSSSSAPLGPVEEPLWMRYPAISPDGSHIAFSYMGNIYVVPAAGGGARLLVSNGAHSTRPVWAQDGKTIAYASDPKGNFDIYAVSSAGGPSKRLTTHSESEFPVSFTPDSKSVIFAAQRDRSATNIGFPARSLTELYKVSLEGNSRPVQILPTPALNAQLDKQGQRLLYEDWKGVESEWRKHHISPVAKDIWLYDFKTSRHVKLTDFGGEDRNPVWSTDERSVYYLSERNGTFNIWRMALNLSAFNTGAIDNNAVQITNFSNNPVRFLSIAKTGTLCFGHDGQIYTLTAGATQPHKVNVRIEADIPEQRIENLKLSQGITEIAVSPNGQEIAFLIRGEIFVASTEFGDTKRITDTPTQERSVSFSPDGRRLLFAGEVDGRWNLYEATLPGSKRDFPYFYAASKVMVKTLLHNENENFQPRYSPDGKEVAYLENRTTLRVLNIASGQTRTVLSGKFNYSYSDGDQWFDWSPDGSSLAVQFLDANRWGEEVGIIDAQGKNPLINLSRNGYDDAHPMFYRGGEGVMWLSDRTGLHASNNQGQLDVFSLALTRREWVRSRLDKSEFSLLKKREDDEKAEKEKTDKLKVDKTQQATPIAPENPAEDKPENAIKLATAVSIETDGLDDRLQRLTPNSGDIRASAMTPDGETLYYVLRTEDTFELWANRLRIKEAKRMAIFPATAQTRTDLQFDGKGETGFLLTAGAIYKFKVPKEDGDVKAERLKFNAEMRLDKVAERNYLFDHIWRQTLEKLYVEDMSGVDWKGYRKTYEKFLPHIADNYDFAEMVSEMLGELNVSHTGAGYRPANTDGDSTASLGAFFDQSFNGSGLKITEIVEGGPLSNALKDGSPAIKVGQIIEKIDGTPILTSTEYDSLLNRKAGQRILLTVIKPENGESTEISVKGISRIELAELLYRRWVKAERAIVDKVSAGRLGYVHVRGMNDKSFRTIFGESLGFQSGKEGLIVDTRFNGGGNLHDQLATFLSGKKYLEFFPRGQSLGYEPRNRWTKPSVVLMSESNYSDAHLFPWTYRHLGIGKLIGMPVAGTGTAVWWETLQDPTLYFGIPMVGFRDSKGIYMERALLQPDIRVANDPSELSSGRDMQLEAAVKELLIH
jgi:tricorn protease